jgi:hypothetical protein
MLVESFISSQQLYVFGEAMGHLSDKICFSWSIPDDGPTSRAMLPPRALFGKGLAETYIAEGVATPDGVRLVEESVADCARYLRP